MAADFDTRFIEEKTMSRLLAQLEFTLGKLCDYQSESTTLSNMSFCSPKDLEAIKTWNSECHPPVEDCIHWENGTESSQASDRVVGICRFF